MLLVIYDTEKCLEIDLFYLEIIGATGKGKMAQAQTFAFQHVYGPCQCEHPDGTY